jgi:hypothetical protein
MTEDKNGASLKAKSAGEEKFSAALEINIS